jgi:hypothetical protein
MESEMGCRAVITFVDRNGYSPAVYLHNAGWRVKQLLTAAAPHLRRGDAGYSAARFCGYCHTQMEGNTGLGLIAAPKAAGPDFNWSAYSHGDNGVFIVNVDTGAVNARGGSGEPFDIDPSTFGK